MILYVNLYREKWVNSKPKLLDVNYYEGETDKNGKVMDFEEFEYFPVTIANGDVMVSTVAKP